MITEEQAKYVLPILKKEVKSTLDMIMLSLIIPPLKGTETKVNDIISRCLTYTETILTIVEGLECEIQKTKQHGVQ
tara:strand:- start:258 stop:485 length:228 start_codon:yes stop_codon:yes gene_type:complete